MQNVSKEYKESMYSAKRNRGYIRVTIGVINSEAQDNITADDSRNTFTYFADITKPFNSYSVEKVYTTCEHDISKVDGSMYFLPPEDEGYELYNNGIVTGDLSGALYITFGGDTAYDIKGLTIDFSDCYPTDFTIQNDNVTYSYNDNDTRYFVTEDVFDDTTYLIITPSVMVNGQGRLRIFQFFCGIVNSFSNVETLSYTSKEYVSSITDTIPSTDVTLTVDNQDMYYSPDNPESTLAYFEVGQEMKVQFGYDVLGDGEIEWVPATTTYLKTWSADETQAKFTATDRFDNMSGTYYKGLYRANGISLYDLALDVLEDAGITDEREYFIDPYLEDIIVYNPMPAVAHTEALQIIANAGRCAMYEDRDSRIHIQASFIPDMVSSANNETEYSHAENLLVDEDKEEYAEASNDLSAVDGTMYFMAADTNYLNTGYISESIADEDGAFDGDNPTITIVLEAAFVAYGIHIRFRNIAPQEFHILTYYEDVLVDDMTVTDPDVDYITHEQFDLFDKMVIEITVGYPNARVVIDNILIGDVTDYVLSRSYSVTSYPTAERQNRIKSISVVRSIYKESADDIKELQQEEIVLSPDDNTYTVYFSNASYGLTASVEDNDNVTVEITDSSNYFATMVFSGLTAETNVKYIVYGYEYVVSENLYTVNHQNSGEEIEWENPLVSSITLAQDLEEWLASYYLGDVEYSVAWRGDPRVDANDLFYLELKDGTQTMIRAYQNELKFSGAWSGTIKARKAVL